MLSRSGLWLTKRQNREGAYRYYVSAFQVPGTSARSTSFRDVKASRNLQGRSGSSHSKSSHVSRSIPSSHPVASISSDWSARSPPFHG